MRKRLFQIIEVSTGADKGSSIYDYVMLTIIIVSLIPLAFKETNSFFLMLDYFSVAIFIIDYILRILTADYKIGKGAMSFALYPFTPLAIIDLLCIIPSFSLLPSGVRLLKIFRLFRTLRVFRTLKVFRYSKSLTTIMSVIKKQSVPLEAVGSLAVGYILIAALIIFNVEPETFDNYFDAIYWATVSLTTMGYGDIYPITTVGRIVTMLSSFIGIAIIALPAGIITAGYMDELRSSKEVD